MTAAAGIPGVPTAALDAISDENTRIVLRAIVDGWQVRNGNTGKGDNRFVTAGELGSVTGARMIGGLTQTLQQEIGKKPMSPGEISRVISDLQSSVLESALWKELGERITLIDKDLIAGLTAEAIARQAAITDESIIRQTAETSLASSIETVTAAVDTNAAAIENEVTARVNGDNATAEQISTQIATVNNSLSALQETQTTTANDVASLASSVSTLQTTVGDNTAAISTESLARANADGLLQAQYTVKVDLNGYVSGFGLASTLIDAAPFSEFIVRADRFAIGSSSGSEIVPFIVTTSSQTLNGRTVPAGVYIDNAIIKNGSITTANIGVAQVDTLLIQDNAVTVSTYDEATLETFTLGTTPTNLCRASISTGVLPEGVGAGTIIVANATLYEQGGSAATIELQILIDEDVVAVSGCTLGDSKTITATAFSKFYQGTHIVSTRVKVSTGAGGAATKSLAVSSGLIVMSGKR